MWRTKELAGQWMDAPAMMRTKSRWNAKMRGGTRRCTVKREDARWNAKMRENAKMRGEMRRCARTRRCAVEREDARARECIARVRESVLSLARYCREAAHNMWNHSTHDGDVALWSPVVMSRKIGQYQPVENWVSTPEVSIADTPERRIY